MRPALETLRALLILSADGPCPDDLWDFCVEGAFDAYLRGWVAEIHIDDDGIEAHVTPSGARALRAQRRRAAKERLERDDQEDVTEE